ncbi:unnamed protein product [Menidia menidia]|uniref:Sulfotransferase n=1 Tax=Menidia menidia TaxID=238744 RepID=A0A8S4BBW5_9TELE|nr:unnamed protein product [Menidia menidia]
MRCSWTSVVLLALASIAIQFTALRTFSSGPFSLLCSVGLAPARCLPNCSLKDGPPGGQGCTDLLPHGPSPVSLSPPALDTNRRTNILILATTRSGSSFVFYLFEPLYHVQLALLPRLAQSRNLAQRRVMLGAARDVLRSLFHCQLHSLESYIQPRPASHLTDKLFRRGASQALCSAPVCAAALGPRERGLVLGDEGECVRRCGALNVSLAAEACRAKRHAAIKTTFRDTYRLWRLWRATGRRPHNLDLRQISTVCDDFLESVSTGLAGPPWLKGRYMLLRPGPVLGPGLCGGPRPAGARPGDEGECVRRCGALNVSLAAEACRAKRHAAIKTVRIPQISDLRALIEDPRLNLKVVQLVRDPRGILASRIETFRDTYRLWRLWRATGRRPHNLDLRQISTVCEDFLESVSTGLAGPPWLKGRYMLLRYEDLAKYPLQKTKDLYRFLGLAFDRSVVGWILNNTRGSSDSASRQKFTTVRDSAANAENWRLKLSFDMVLHTQAACQPLLGLLGWWFLRPAPVESECDVNKPVVDVLPCAFL